MNTNDEGKPLDNTFLSMSGGATCPVCGSHEFEMRNYSMIWHDGDIHCALCGEFIRVFDAG